MVLINNVRAKREEQSVKTGAPPLVGPGRYSPKENPYDRNKDERNVPFESLSDRPNVARQQSTINAPGPGTYVVRREMTDPATKVESKARFIESSASAFRARSPQIASKVMMKESPGPAADYDICADLIKPLQVKKDSKHGLASISYSKSQCSMPPTRDPKEMKFKGREVDVRNSIAGDQMGPSDIAYDGKMPLSMSRLNQVANFHASPTQRGLFEHSASIDNKCPPYDFPAPGEYLTDGKLERGPISPFMSKSPQVPSMGNTQDIPGPGTYTGDVENEFLRDLSSPNSHPLTNASNRSTSERSQSWQLLSHPFTHPEYVYKVPGPGTYPNPPGFHGSKIRRARSQPDVIDVRKFHAVHQPHQVVSLRDSEGLKLHGFDCGDVRPMHKNDKGNGVPSLAYNVEDSMGQSIMSNLKEPAKIGKKGPFGSQSERFQHFVKYNGFVHNEPPKPQCPGPGEHQDLTKAPPLSNMKGEHSVCGFRSQQERLPKDPLRDKGTKPDPGEYDVCHKVNYRNQFRKAKDDHLSFGSSASRWNPQETFVGQKGNDNPGPGLYKPQLAVGNIPGAAQGYSLRGVGEPKFEGLGPDHQYNTHGSTMHRTTHNVTGQEALQKSQGWSPMEPPNIGGGAGGGISATRARLGHSHGGSGANQLQANEKGWAEDRRLAEKLTASVKKAASKQGWLALTDGSASPSATMEMPPSKPKPPDRRPKSALKQTTNYPESAGPSAAPPMEQTMAFATEVGAEVAAPSAAAAPPPEAAPAAEES